MSEQKESLESTTEAPQSKEELLKEARIWVVDDEEIIRVLVEKILRLKGCSDISVFPDGQNALEEYQRKIKGKELLPDLIVSDFNMSRLNGDELCEKIKSVSEKESIEPPIFIIASGRTSLITGENKKRLLEKGVSDTLRKPFTIQQLEKAVVEDLEGRPQK